MTNDVLEKLKTPAIGLIATGVLNGLFGILIIVSGLLRLTGITGKEQIPTDQAERIGYLIGTFAGYGVGILSLILAPVILYGGLKMLKGENRKLAMAAAVLAVIPLTSCCFAAGAIFGIWALAVMSKPEVKAFFQRN